MTHMVDGPDVTDNCGTCGQPIVLRGDTWSHVNRGDEQTPYLHGPVGAAPGADR